MIHGLFASSDVWVINNPSNALAFNLADSGFDVWLGNCRGNPYGSGHLSMSPNDREFWRFSWDDIADIDLPITIDYILKESKQSALHYVGHSQGTAIIMALLSTKPSYNAKLKTVHFFAPIAYMTHSTSMLILVATPILGTYNILDPLLGDRSFLQNALINNISGISKCRSPLAPPQLCNFLYAIFTGPSNYTPTVSTHFKF